MRTTSVRVDVAELVGLRTHHPEAVAEAAARRAGRPLIDDTGRLMVDTAVGLL